MWIPLAFVNSPPSTPAITDPSSTSYSLAPEPDAAHPRWETVGGPCLPSSERHKGRASHFLKLKFLLGRSLSELWWDGLSQLLLSIPAAGNKIEEFVLTLVCLFFLTDATRFSFDPEPPLYVCFKLCFCSSSWRAFSFLRALTVF